MKHVFTDYVRVLAAGGSADDELAKAVWEKLRSALAGELHRRGLWNAPPGYLGLHSSHSWSEGDALEELTADVFAYNHRRASSMAAQLKVRDSVEGMWFRNIRNFLYNTQRKLDPIGFRCFLLAQTACRQLIDDGTLRVLEGKPTVRNETVLGFAAGEARGAALDDLVRRWNDELLPGLITARRKNKDEVVARLAARISQLPASGVEVFRFKDLLDPLKNDARDRWHAIGMRQEGEVAIEAGDREQAFPRLVRLIRPDSSFEERESFGKLLACVAEALDRFEGRAKTRTYLERFWDLLRNHAAEPADEAELPAGRQMAETLGIPRGRLPDLLSKLGAFIEDCQGAAGSA